MSYFRTLSATLLAAAATFMLVTASSGCGTKAVGVDDCRDIEQARCRAEASCLDSHGTPLIQDVGACERYYRDHCLHGLASKAPAGADVAGCVQVIEAAGRCAKDDPESELGCSDTATEPADGFRTACELIAHPERASECAFLSDGSQGQGEGVGGQSGTDASDDASAGQTSGSAGETAQAGATVE